ncbi:saccharopine dehydrogenase family protein [Nocardia gipuzkoensis]
MRGVDQLIVTDLDETVAVSVAAELGPVARGVALDVGDRVGLRRLLAKSDVVLNTVGPFYRYGVEILSAAVDADCHYLDVCDDPEPLEPMFALNRKARARGVVAVTGLGVAPGVTNLLAVLAASELDTVRVVIAGANAESAVSEFVARGRLDAALDHGIKQVTGHIPVMRGGREALERPLRKTHIDYPGSDCARSTPSGIRNR